MIDNKDYKYQVKHYFKSLIDVTLLMIDDTINTLPTIEEKEKYLDELFKDYDKEQKKYKTQKKNLKLKEITENKIDKTDIKKYNYLGVLIKYTEEILKKIKDIYHKLNSKDSSSPRRLTTRRSSPRTNTTRRSRPKSILRHYSKYSN
jgi:hypothetical protein